MTLPFHPHPATLLICDFDTGFRPPEIVKKRPVVVVSPRRRRGSGLCTVVPLSSTPPEVVEDFHHRMSMDSLVGKLRRKETWAKCDLLYTVSLERLDRVLVGKNQDGRRQYRAPRVTPDDFAAILQGVKAGLGLDGI